MQIIKIDKLPPTDINLIGYGCRCLSVFNMIYFFSRDIDAETPTEAVGVSGGESVLPLSSNKQNSLKLDCINTAFEFLNK